MPELRHWLTAAAQRLPGEAARLEAELLLAHALRRPRAWLYAHADEALSPEQVASADALIARRAGGEPVAYITGSRGFWDLELAVTPATLIPRPETELLVELALQRIAPIAAARVADLGTGSGAIALAIARERPRAEVWATDRSAEALTIASANARRAGLERVRFAQGDWCSALPPGRFDVIVSNPPYIADDDPHLDAGDLRFEPRTALASGPDGLDDIRRLVASAKDHLARGGILLFEHGFLQGEAVRGLLVAAGYGEVFTAQDLEARDRVSGGTAA